MIDYTTVPAPTADLYLDREPIATRLPFHYNSTKKEEDNTMDLRAYVKFIIEHCDEVPNVTPIDLETAELMTFNTFKDDIHAPKDLTAQNFMDTWNDLLKHPEELNLE